MPKRLPLRRWELPRQARRPWSAWCSGRRQAARRRWPSAPGPGPARAPASPPAIGAGSASLVHFSDQLHAKLVLALVILGEVLGHARFVVELEPCPEQLLLRDQHHKARLLPGRELGILRVVALHGDADHVLTRRDRMFVDGLGL